MLRPYPSTVAVIRSRRWTWRSSAREGFPSPRAERSGPSRLYSVGASLLLGLLGEPLLDFLLLGLRLVGLGLGPGLGCLALSLALLLLGFALLLELGVVGDVTDDFLGLALHLLT